MRRALIGTAIICTALSIAYSVTGVVWYGLGTLDKPKAGVYPLLAGSLLFVASLGVGLTAARSKATQSDIEWPSVAGRIRLAVILGAVITYVILFEYLGFLTAALLLSLAGFQAMGGFRWRVRISFTVAIVGVFYYVFCIILRVPLPIWI